MNEPIISPWIFYIADVCQGLNIILLIAITCIFATAVIAFCSDQYDVLKRVIVALITVSLIFILVPGRDTLYKIAIARQLTPANIQKAGDSLDTVIDKAIEKIQKLQMNTNPK